MTPLGRPATRISIALVCMTAGVLLLADLFGLMPREEEASLASRAVITEALAVQTAVAVNTGELATLRRTLELFVERNEEVLSTALRQADGRILIEAGKHREHWGDPLEDWKSTPERAQVPIFKEGKRPWGSIEVRFEPVTAKGVSGWVTPLVKLILFVSLGCFVSYLYFMKKTLKYLDPSAVVPERVKATLDTLAEGVVLIDQAERVVLANRAFSDQVQMSATALTGEKVSGLGWTDPETGAAPAEIPWLSSMKDGEIRTAQSLALSTGGTSRSFMVNSAPIVDPSGKTRGALATFDETTKLEELNDLLRTLAKRDREARKMAEDAGKAKSEFLAVMSHEIRTPMNVVVGMAELLKDTNLAPDQIDCLDSIEKASDALLTVINDILDYSKIEAGRLELENTQMDLRACVDDVASILSPKAYENGLEFPVFVDHRISDNLLGDPTRLKQILINFGSNAIKFTDQGDVGIHVQPMASSEGKVGLRFEVRDSGIGIPKDRLGRLFQSFSQVDSSTTRKYGGTGLGLVICKRLVEAMDGQIGVESEEGLGSTFWFEIELDVDPSASASASLEGIQNENVVIISPHLKTGEGLAEKVRVLGAVPFVATNPRDALAHIEGGDGAAVLVRYPIPDPSWEGALERLRNAPGVSVLLMPTLHERKAAEQEISRGYAGVLCQPVKLQQLRLALSSALGLAAVAESEGDHEVAEEKKVDRSRFRILVADDYQLNQQLAVRLVQRAGYSCDVVNNGKEAVAAVETGAYDLVLMDGQMPEMDGYTATREIRKREDVTGEHIPVIAMTANAGKNDRDYCLEMGMDDYVSKPVQTAILYELLEKYLDAAIPAVARSPHSAGAEGSGA